MSLNFDIHRVLQFFWDPIPKNDDPHRSTIWCLGSAYKSPALEERITVSAAAAAAEARAAAKAAREAEAALQQEGGSRPPNILAPRNSQQLQRDEVQQPASTEDEEEPLPSPNVDDAGWPLVFLDDVEAKLWMTYRSGFTTIPRSKTGQAKLSLSTKLRNLGDPEGFGSDTGWGCMIRSGQSVLANTLSVLELGRDWRRGTNPDGERKLISLFADDPQAPFSIQKFVDHAENYCGLPSGQWFGPNVTARCIKALVEASKIDLGIYLNTESSDIYQDEFLKVAKTDKGFRPTLLLIPTRLGHEMVTMVYWEALKSVLTMPQCMGIAGGRPSSSHYFIGVQKDYLFYLDPHSTRPHIPYRSDLSEYTAEEIDSCHTRRLRRIHIKEMDPSMLLAFLIKDEKDWTALKQGVKEVQGKRIVHITDTKPKIRSPEELMADVEALDTEDEEEKNSEAEIIDAPSSGRTSEAEIVDAPTEEEEETIKTPTAVPGATGATGAAIAAS